ncbi:hypothetical protein QG37_04447 [Candidozyma auris]|uniref:Uncharacterized protein n=1 Tax=Candidozyma auris TaxID=498019 RepID=A0A0L0NWL2_CANAR|nr:hypothetical protein QG37_04447 [[Candida] auris]
MKPQTEHLPEITEKVIRAPLQKAIDAPWVLCDSGMKQILDFKSRSIIYGAPWSVNIYQL